MAEDRGVMRPFGIESDYLTAILAGHAARVATEMTSQAEREHMRSSRGPTCVTLQLP
ncbi:hypothetical protein [Streptomyces sp. NPDC046862]|uniref:hypothetical protein n=1 Tax=Streptomyces sp. NPDC046862 TaxID=3154603 RepID=UPI00345605B0